VTPRLVVGSFEVQPRRNLVIDSEGVEVRIKPRSMQLLLHLSASPGKVISREQILDAVWEGVSVGDEVLTVAVAELRKAFRDDSKDPRYIQTLSGKGYVLVAEVSDVSESAMDGNSRGSKWRSLSKWTGLTLAAILVALWIATRGGDDRKTAGGITYRLDFTAPDSAPVTVRLSRPFAISPEGTRMVYVTGRLTRQFELRLRHMNDPET